MSRPTGNRIRFGFAPARDLTHWSGGSCARPIPAARELCGNGRKANKEVTLYG